MQAPASHPRESQRLAALRALHILDSAPEPRFDALTRTACRVFGVPTVLISLVDEGRQWFKSRQGLDPTETPRDISFCGHAILGEQPFVVEDALRDPRFLDNPLVAGDLGLRFYAGMPLHSPDGLPYGTLCLIDYSPRTFTPEQEGALRDLALLAEDELNRALPANLIARMEALVATMGEGVVFLDAAGVITSANPAAERILGLPLAQVQGRDIRDARWQAIHENGEPWALEDFPAVVALETGRPDVGRFMGLHRPDGSIAWMIVNAQPLKDATGNLTGVACAFLDITARKDAEATLRKAEERYRAMTENVPGVMYQFQVWPDGRVEFPFISDSVTRLYGITAQQWRQDPLWSLNAILPEDRPSYEAAYAHAARDTQAFLWEGRTHTARPGEVIWIRCQSQPSPQADGSILWDGIVTDITSLQLQAEAQARQAAFQKSLLQSAEVAIISTDLTGTVTSFNAHAEALLGWSAAEVVGVETPALWHDPAEVVARAAELGQRYDREFQPGFDVFVHQCRLGSTEQRQWSWLTRDGYRLPILLNVSGIRDATDTLVGFLGIGADLRAIKAREAAQRASEQQFRDLVASVPGIVYQVRPLAEGKREFTFISDYSRVLLGMEPAEVLANPGWIEQMVHPEDRESLFQTLASGREARVPAEWVGRIHRPSDGQTRWIRIQATPWVAADGSALWNGLILDLTERIGSELALRESEERLALILKGSNDAPWDQDLAHGSHYYSPRWWAMLGYSDQELPADPGLPDRLMHPEDRARVAAEMAAALEGRRDSYELEFRLRHKEGRYVPVLSRGFIQRREDGLPVRISGTHMDLTERKAVEEALRHSEERWSLALQANNDGIWDWNTITDEVWFSPRYLSILGYAPGELPGTLETWSTLCHPEDLPGAVAQITAYKEGRSPTYQLIFRMRHRDGSYRWVLSRGVGKAGPDGRMLRVVGSHQDITMQREAERALMESESQNRILLENTTDILARHDRAGRFTFITPSVQTVLGRPLAAYLQQLPKPFIHAEDWPLLQSTHLRLLAGEACPPIRYRARHLEGHFVWLESQGSTIKDPDTGQIREVIFTSRDVTSRITTEEALVASQARSQALLEAMPDLIFLVRRDGLHLEVHAHSESSLRVPKDQILGKYMHEVMPSELLEERMARIARVLDSGVPESYESQVETMAGLQDHETRVVPCGKDTVLVIARDITERKALERLKSDFISTVSHELRTPLTSIKGALGLLTGGVTGDLSSKGLELSRMALENANRLARLIDDLLDLAKTESAELSLDPQRHDLRKLIGQALEGIAGFAQTHHITLAPTWPSEAALALVDGDRLIQVVLNLLSNAVKYSHPSGAVAIRLAREGRLWRLEIENHGPEIPEAFRSRIFQKFAMADASDTRVRGGTGLGLAISKALVERMGGGIDYHSASGRTVFRVELPLPEEIP